MHHLVASSRLGEKKCVKYRLSSLNSVYLRCAVGTRNGVSLSEKNKTENYRSGFDFIQRYFWINNKKNVLCKSLGAVIRANSFLFCFFFIENEVTA